MGYIEFRNFARAQLALGLQKRRPLSLPVVMCQDVSVSAWLFPMFHGSQQACLWSGRKVISRLGFVVGAGASIVAPGRVFETSEVFVELKR